MRLIDLNLSIKTDNNDKVISFLKQNPSDIITLQEVMRGIDETVYDKYNNSAKLKEELPEYKYSFFGGLWVAPYHLKNQEVSKDFGGLAEQGNEVITKFPILEAENIFYHKNYQQFIDITDFRKTDHARAFEKVILKIGTKKLQIINIHGIWNKEKSGDDRTEKQCELLLEIALQEEIPTIIAGDFNLNPTSSSIQIVNQKFINLIEKYHIQTTRPTVKNGMAVKESIDDYIFINDQINVIDFQVIKTDISDHYPLILEFDFADKK